MKLIVYHVNQINSFDIERYTENIEVKHAFSKHGMTEILNVIAHLKIRVI